MAKKQVEYIVINGFENDTARYEIGTAVTETELKKAGFTVAGLLEIGVIRPFEEGEHNGDGQN